MQIDKIGDIESLRRHRENWDAVYDADPEANFFLSWTWIGNWLDSIDDTWFVLAAKPSQQSTSYVAFFPIQLWSEPSADNKFINTVRMGGQKLAGFSGFICDPAHAGSAISAFANELLNFNWTKIHLDRVLASEDRMKKFIDVFSGPEFGLVVYDQAPEGSAIDLYTYPYIELPDDWDTYLMSHMGAKTRRNARIAWRSLDSGDLHVTHATKESFARDVETILQFWQDKWGANQTAQQVQRELSNFRHMLRACFEDEALLLPILWRDDKPLAGLARLIDKKNKTLIALMDGRGPAKERPPPGFLLNLYAIRWAIEHGFKTYDMQLGNYSYKYDFGPQDRRLDPHLIYTKSNENLGGRLDPHCLSVVFAMSKNYVASGDIEMAATGCRQILEVDPKHSGASDLLEKINAETSVTNRVEEARRMSQQGNIDEAIDILESILDAEPKNFAARYLLGLAFLQQENFQAAEKHIKRAITMDSNAATAHYNYGLALKGLGHLPKALKSFKRAIALRPDYPAAIKNRDQVARDMKRRA